MFRMKLTKPKLSVCNYELVIKKLKQKKLDYNLFSCLILSDDG